MALQAKAVKTQQEDGVAPEVSGLFRFKTCHRAPGTNHRNVHHPVTTIYSRRFTKSYRDYGFVSCKDLAIATCLFFAACVGGFAVTCTIKGAYTFFHPNAVACTTKTTQ